MAFKFGVEQNGVLAALSPPMQMLLFSEGGTVSICLGLAADLGIADLLAEGPRSSTELAEATSTHSGSLCRLLRLLTSFGIFSEIEPDWFGQTPLSELLRTGTAGSLRSWMRMLGLPVWWHTFADAAHSIRTGEPAFRRVVGADFFEYLAAHPRDGDLFNQAMTAFGQDVAEAVTRAYDFGPIRTVVDVGGGRGLLISTILRSHASLTGTLFELPHVAEDARAALAAAGVADRCEIATGDFFQSVPTGGDAYILSWIIHDWNRDRAVALLRNCRRAMHPASRLLLIEGVIPDGDEPHFGKIMDVVMLVLLGGQERTGQQYGDLLREADFALSRVIPTDSPMSIIEGAPI